MSFSFSYLQYSSFKENGCKQANGEIRKVGLLGIRKDSEVETLGSRM